MYSERIKRKKMKDKSTRRGFKVCLAFTLAFLTLFVCRLVDWQLVHGEYYKQLSKRSTSYTIETEAVRGEILDRNGAGLVVNKTHYRLVLDKLYADEKSLNSTLLQLSSLLEKTGQRSETALPIELSEGTVRFKENSGEAVSYLQTEVLKTDENTPAPKCLELLLKRYEIKGDYVLKEKLCLADIHYNMELEDYSNTKPYVFAGDIDRSAVVAISENTQGIGGVELQTYLVREAENPTLAPHLLGALGAITEDELEKLSKSGKAYALSDSVGKFGIEKAFEEELKGEGGAKIVKRNSNGAITDAVETLNAKPGNTVFLTIDEKIQSTAAKSLEKNVKAAKAAGKATGGKHNGEDCETGAAVMLSVKDFSVLAAASYPNYDLNKYSEYGDYYIKLENDETAPMFNRVSVGSFACGSVYKPCVALAALEENILKPDTEIFCKQSYDYYPSNPVRCMHYHGDLDLNGAITRSCNYFFAETGRRLGIEPMYLYSEKFGLGEYTGIEIEESKGTLAGRDSTGFVPGNTVQAAIGQSDNAFTPLQLATYAATIANNGTRLKTHVVSKLTDYERTDILKQSEPEIIDSAGISEKNLKLVQNAMLSVTQDKSGTANYMFGDYKIKVAAKTGTAENSGSDHTTFICYAPFEKPEVAVAVVIEHGAKGRYSMQVAKDMLNSYFEQK